MGVPTNKTDGAISKKRRRMPDEGATATDEVQPKRQPSREMMDLKRQLNLKLKLKKKTVKAEKENKVTTTKKTTTTTTTAKKTTTTTAKTTTTTGVVTSKGSTPSASVLALALALPPSPDLSFPHRFIMAPMVGASELPFRLLCRKYGAQLCYTPMMMASEFVSSPDYRRKEFQTTPFDRPLCCHFAANTPKDFAAAAKIAAPFCDAIDLNLGCPQRTAYVGHFGSYLLDPKDRALIVKIVKAGVAAVDIPICVKIRLLDTFEETFQLVTQLYEAGATLIAIHARYRATFHRKGAGARDGPALLDEVRELQEHFPNRFLVTNGNTITYQDVVQNLAMTKARGGIMSAEGILDNPALYLERYGRREKEKETDDNVRPTDATNTNTNATIPVKGGAILQARAHATKLQMKRRKLLTKMQHNQFSTTTMMTTAKDKMSKLERKQRKIQTKLEELDKEIYDKLGTEASTAVPLQELWEAADDKPALALEYLQLVREYPATMRTAIFHTRRMIKTELTTYQLMEECLKCQSIDALEGLVHKVRGYQRDPPSFQFDKTKATQEKEALERKKREEGKRKEYEARMIRKAKREKRDDLEYYLRQGSAVPTAATIEALQAMKGEDSQQQQMQLWKDREHGQHCLRFHLLGECPRGRGCAFLHVSPSTDTTFDEANEVAG